MQRALAIACAILGACGGTSAQPAPALPSGSAVDSPAPLEQPVEAVTPARDRWQDIQAARDGGGSVGEPDPNVAYAVPLAGDPTEGPVSAKVTIVVFTELGGRCPYCVRFADTTREIRSHYGDAVRIAIKHEVVHAESSSMYSLAGCAAQKQGKFFEMADKLWPLQDASSWDVVSAAATGIGLDLEKFARDVESDECVADVVGDMALGARVGVHGTPSSYIDGRVVVGSQPFDTFRPLIDAELKKADAAIAGGVSPEGYYEEVVKNGRPTAP